MVTNIKTRKSPKSPSLLPETELEKLIREITQIVRTARTIHDRRELVLRLLARGVRRGEMIRLLCKPFGIEPKTLDDDIRWAKDYWLNWSMSKGRAEAMAEAVMTSQEIKRLAIAKGDLSAANQANRMFSEIYRLTAQQEAPSVNPAIDAKNVTDEVQNISMLREMPIEALERQIIEEEAHAKSVKQQLRLPEPAPKEGAAGKKKGSRKPSGVHKVHKGRVQRRRVPQENIRTPGQSGQGRA